MTIPASITGTVTKNLADHPYGIYGAACVLGLGAWPMGSRTTAHSEIVQEMAEQESPVVGRADSGYQR